MEQMMAFSKYKKEVLSGWSFNGQDFTIALPATNIKTRQMLLKLISYKTKHRSTNSTIPNHDRQTESQKHWANQQAKAFSIPFTKNSQ